jgi:predicted DCC family thiol-disulfide oxidoreductase YuxK
MATLYLWLGTGGGIVSWVRDCRAAGARISEGMDQLAGLGPGQRREKRMDERQLVIFDGVCNLCNAAVRFIIERDPDGLFVFTPMQSELARELYRQYELGDAGAETLVLIKQEQCFTLSSAALEIAGDLAGPVRWLRAFRVVPAVLRDPVYKLIARHRYALFGRRDRCMVPCESLRSRFVGI